MLRPTERNLHEQPPTHRVREVVHEGVPRGLLGVLGFPELAHLALHVDDSFRELFSGSGRVRRKAATSDSIFT